MDFGLKDKIAIVTGAAGAIGGAIARDLAAEGAKLALVYHTKTCEELVEEIRRLGQEVIAIQADVTNSNDVTNIVESTYKKFGRIDILVNNAGIGVRGAVEDTSEEDWDRTITTNLKSVFLLSKAVIKYMKQQRWGRIVNIGSVVAKTSTNARPWLDPQDSSKAGGGAYAASKAGVHTLTKTMAKELAAFGVTVNSVAPGPIQTAMTPALPAPMKDQMPISRIGYPEEVSAFVVILASQRASFVTGEVIDVNGGVWMD